MGKNDPNDQIPLFFKPYPLIFPKKRREDLLFFGDMRK
jgi:hypothetical protein